MYRSTMIRVKSDIYQDTVTTVTAYIVFISYFYFVNFFVFD